MPPGGPTIDYELSKVLPETLLPHLCIGMDSIENMRAKPTVANLSASGAGQPIFMHSNPNHLYQLLYGGISEGDIRDQHEARSSMLQRSEKMSSLEGKALPSNDKNRYDQYVRGFEDMNDCVIDWRRCPDISRNLLLRWMKDTPTPNSKPIGTTPFWILAFLP